MLEISALVAANLALFSASTVPIQGPQLTYLRCTFGAVPVLITMDEANSVTTVSLPTTGHIQKSGAAFTATDVRFSDGGIRYVVSRTDLSASRYIAILQSTEQGTCKVETPPKRAF